MAKYKIVITRSASKEINKLSPVDLKNVLAKIEALSEDPQLKPAVKLSREAKFRLRQGTCRLLYTVGEEVLIVCAVETGKRPRGQLAS